MRKTDLAYVAGLIDADGFIVISKRKQSKPHYSRYELQVGLGNKSHWLTERLKFWFGGSVHRSKARGEVIYWTWCLYAKQAQEFLERLLSYLTIKRPEAELGIFFQKQKGNPGPGHSQGERDREEALWSLMRQFHQSTRG